MVTVAGFIILAFTYSDKELSTKDDDPANEVLRNDSFIKFRRWIIFTSVSVFCLFFITSQIGSNYMSKDVFIIAVYVSIILNIHSFVWGMGFVFYFLNPNTIKIVTNRELRTITKKHSSQSEEIIDSKEFIDKYLTLENKINGIIYHAGFDQKKLSRNEVISLLKIRGILDAASIEKLQDVMKMKSLIVKGDIYKIDSSLNQTINEIFSQVEKYDNK